MKKITIVLILIVFIQLNLFAKDDKYKDKDTVFVKGAGAKYIMKSGNIGKAYMAIYFAKSDPGHLAIEYYINSIDSIIPVKLWQQFTLARPADSGIKVVAGYILDEHLKKPQKMTSEHLKGTEGVLIDDFLFKKRSELSKFLVAKEIVEVPAGSVQADHYRKNRNGQIVDFWISPKAGAMGLIKLISKGKKASQNYTLELLSLLKNVAAKIDPKKSILLNDKGRALLSIK